MKKKHLGLWILGGAAAVGAGVFYAHEKFRSITLPVGGGTVASGVTGTGQSLAVNLPTGATLTSLTDSSFAAQKSPVVYNGTPAVGSGQTWLIATFTPQGGTVPVISAITV